VLCRRWGAGGLAVKWIASLSNKVGQSRLGLGPRELARSGGVYSTEREQDQQRLVRRAVTVALVQPERS